MADRGAPYESDDDFELIESLLREMTSEDRQLVEPPDDLWGRIEAEADVGVETNVVSLDRRRRSFPRFAAIGAAAAAAVIVFGGIVFAAQRDDNDTTLLASAQLSYDAASFDALGANAAAHVSLVDDGGTLRVDIDESDLPSAIGDSADLELWLIEPDADGNPAELVSLGLIDPANPGDFVVPDTYDPDVYFVVDISVEPRDGNASHSGRSILRGPLVEV